MNHILIPTDFSNNAYSALLYATRLYKNESCVFYILHSYDDEVSRNTSRIDIGKTERIADEARAVSKTELTAIRHHIIRDTEGFPHDFEILSTARALVPGIEDAIRKNDIDLIVMGTKGATGLKRTFFGSNTVDVISKIKQCPILCIPNEFLFVNPEEIAFPTDFKHTFSSEELSLLLEIAKRFESTIRIVHIYEEDQLDSEQEENLNTIKYLIEPVKHSEHWVPNVPKKADTIQDFIEIMNISLLVLTNRSHGLLERITREPVVKKIGFSSTIPFLIIPQ